MSAAVQAASKVKKDTRDDGYVGPMDPQIASVPQRVASKAWRSCSTHGARSRQDRCDPTQNPLDEVTARRLYSIGSLHPAALGPFLDTRFRSISIRPRAPSIRKRFFVSGSDATYDLGPRPIWQVVRATPFSLGS